MKVERINVTNQIIEYLKKNIADGVWQEGEKISSENELTKELGVSRASVRTAIQHLTGIGVLESVHGKGTYLRNKDVENWSSLEDMITARDCRDIAKVLEFRQIVEPDACYLAVQRGSRELVPGLEKWLAEMVKNEGNKSQFVQADINFHRTIYRATDNPLLEKSMTRIFTETRAYHEKMNDIFGYQEGIREHGNILRAVKIGDASLAKKAMYDHIESGIRRL